VLHLKGEIVEAKIGQLNISDLRFYPKNPRVYSVLHEDGVEPSQEDIEAALLEEEHVKSLIQEIKEAGGLIEPLYVRAGSNDVLEGNSRLAALRFLQSKQPLKWNTVQCVVLPQSLSESHISALLSRFHLIGKTQWPPYEKAGHLYRRFKEDGVSVDELVSETGFKRPVVVKTIEAYEMMLRHNDKKRDRWSYYQEFVKSTTIARACKDVAGFEDSVVEKIKSGEIPTAADLRDQLPVICKSGPKTIKKFVGGKLDFDEALEEAKTIGADDRSLSRLKNFRKWLAQTDNQDDVAAAQGKLRSQLNFEVQQLKKLILGFDKKLAVKWDNGRTGR
jgi:hypothetical protein